MRHTQLPLASPLLLCNCSYLESAIALVEYSPLVTKKGYVHSLGSGINTYIALSHPHSLTTISQNDTEDSPRYQAIAKRLNREQMPYRLIPLGAIDVEIGALTCIIIVCHVSLSVAVLY
jgi:hypothetical protein